MFIIQCPILWYAKVCALPSAHSSFICYNTIRKSDLTFGLQVCSYPLVFTALLRILAVTPPQRPCAHEWNVLFIYSINWMAGCNKQPVLNKTCCFCWAAMCAGGPHGSASKETHLAHKAKDCGSFYYEPGYRCIVYKIMHKKSLNF